MEELLESWGVPHNIKENFVNNGITIELLPKLSPDMLKELCPHLATRLLINEKIVELVTAAAPTESNSSILSINNPSNNSIANETNNIEISISLDDIQVHELLELPRKTFPQFDLQTLLQTSAGGNSILKFFETYGCLDQAKRNQLTDIIIKHLYTFIVNNRITNEEYNVIAAKIITLFPKESIGTYFSKPIRKINSINGRSTTACGKLVDKVRNLLYKYGDRKRRANSLENIPPEKKVNYEDLQNLHSRDIVFLNNQVEPWEEVLQRWKNTFNIRKESQHQSVQEFINNWRILNDNRSEVLINVDFDLLYPEKGLNFYLNWTSFFEKLIALRVSHEERIKILIKSLEDLDEDSKIPTQLKIIAHLVPPKGRISKKIKFSIQEALDSLYICVPNSGDIDKVIYKQKQRAKANKLSVQPYIIIQGTLQDCNSPLIVVDEVKYNFSSVNKAFDTLFKLYHTFHVRYPRAGDYLYLVIQRCVYKIETKYDNVVSYITDILNM